MPRPSDWVLLTQVHPHILKRSEIPQKELLDALPDDAFERGAQRVPLSVPEPGPSMPLADIDWPAWQHAQGELVEEQVRPALDRYCDHSVAYFGATFIPLALDLGYRLGTFRKVNVFQHHHREYHWRWMGAGKSVVVKREGFPTEVMKVAGDVVVRVCTSFTVSDKAVAAVVPDHIADVHISLEKTDIDALSSPEDLDAAVRAFQEAMEAVMRYRPGVRRIHLFIAGPVGLSFRLGQAIPTTVPPIQTYQYDGATQQYRPALILPPPPYRASAKPLPQAGGKPRMLLLSAHPTNAAQLRIGREHDDLIRRVGPEHLDMSVRLSVRVKEIQEMLDTLKPAFLHLAGHGDRSGALFLEQVDGTSAPIPVSALHNLLRLVKQDGEPTQLLFLNACHSEHLAKAVTSDGTARFAIGMHEKISDDAALHFADAFYRRLDKGADLQSAFDWGCNAIEIHQLTARETGTPRLFHAPGEDPRTVLVPR